MRKHLLAGAAVLMACAMFGVLWHVLHPAGSAESCEARMRQAVRAQEYIPTRPPECDGLDQRTHEEIMGRVLESEFERMLGEGGS